MSYLHACDGANIHTLNSNSIRLHHLTEAPQINLIPLTV
jgi:hypothetical protein